MVFPLGKKLTPQRFLKTYWQKKPLLIREAFPSKIEDLITPASLFKMAAREETRSRLIIRKKNKWELHHGPFRPYDLKHLPGKNWTLLVQGVNLADTNGAELLKDFRFIPYARLDDLMISYAAPLGGVGPHFDSYDVFLLQGHGERKWQIGEQQDLSLVPNMPLKILRSFKPENEWVLRSGDMLYLPPKVAHNGIALNECMTYSIGFRAPGNQELFTEFLIFLQENLNFSGIYEDPDLKLQNNPAKIGDEMIVQVEKLMQKVNWRKADIANFLGQYLTEPQAHVFFTGPSRKIGKPAFLKLVHKFGVKLDLKSQMLYVNQTIYLNGESYSFDKKNTLALTQLANNKYLPSEFSLPKDTADLLYEWYLTGYIAINRI